MVGNHVGAKNESVVGIMTTSTALHSNGSKNSHWFLGLIAAFFRDLPRLITTGFVDEFFGTGYQPSVRAISAKRRAVTAVLHRFVAGHRLVHRTPGAAGRQGHASRRPARKAARTRASGDDGDGGGDGGGEPPHRVSHSLTPECGGGVA